MRYSDRRKMEKSRRDKTDWAERFQPSIKKRDTSTKEAVLRIPVRLDEKTVVFVREYNLHRYKHILGGLSGVEKHRERFHLCPDSFKV
jgi:hypothetical protein